GEVELVGHLGIFPFDCDEMTHVPEHSPKLRRVGVHDAPADLAEAERAQRSLVTRGLADSALDLGDLERAHSAASSSGAASSATWFSSRAPTAGAAGSSSGLAAVRGSGKTSAIVLPRSSATSSGRMSRRNPSTVARGMLLCA